MNSRHCVLGDHISGGGGVNLMHFLFLCVLGDFLGGIWDSGGIPQEIAGINTEFIYFVQKGRSSEADISDPVHQGVAPSPHSGSDD